VDDALLCTLDELTELVGDALAVDYRGAPTGRVRDVPDRRVIRWYVTRGLVDRPVASRGRTALYGHRHLLQLVAIKRRQADGRSLAEIQAELTGVTDDVLAEIARLTPTAGCDPPAPEPPAGPVRARFWAADRPVASDAAMPPRGATETAVVAAPLAGIGATPATADPSQAAAAGWPGDGWAMHGVRLAPGVILLIEDAAPITADAATIRAAARPLLDLLAGRPAGAQPRSGHATRRQP
jgi:hypothetical protein